MGKAAGTLATFPLPLAARRLHDVCGPIWHCAFDLENLGLLSPWPSQLRYGNRGHDHSVGRLVESCYVGRDLSDVCNFNKYKKISKY